MAKADKTKKNGDRSTTSVNINKEDVEQFNQLKAKETGRRGASTSQQEFIKLLMCLYQGVLEHDSTLIDEARKKAESR